MSKTEYNIDCIHQLPCSTFTNVLDLGAWTIFQSEAERRHFMKHCHIKALVSTVMSTWDESKLNWQIENIFKILEKILCLINKGEGNNYMVKSKRGEKNCDLKLDLKLSTDNIAKVKELPLPTKTQ